MRTLALAVLALLGCALVSAADGSPAEAIAKAYGSPRGIAIEAGGADASLAIALAKASELHVYRVAPDEKTAANERAVVEAAGLSALRVRVEAGPLAALEYPRYGANVLVAAGLPDEALLKECARALRPEGLLVLVPEKGGALDAAAAKAHLEKTTPGAWQTPAAGTGFVVAARAKLAGAAEWTHYFREPGNNRCSPDTNIADPLRVLWYGEPEQPLGDLFYTQALTAGGRLFLTDAYPEDTTRARLTCLDAYNGVQLWVRVAGAPRYTKVEGTSNDKTIRAFQLPGRVAPGEMAVTAERLYLADNADCLVLDTQSGADVERIKAPAPTHANNCWRYVALLDVMLLGQTDAPVAMYDPRPPKDAPPPPAGGPATLFALDLKTKAPKWVRGGDGDELGADFGQPLAIGAGKIFMRAGKTALVALDTQSGKTAWKVQGLDEDDPAKAAWWEAAVQGETLHLYKFNMRTWGQKKMTAALAFATADGKRISETTEDLAKADFFDRKDGFLGAPPSPRLGCNYGSAAGNLFFHRNAYFVAREGVPISNGIQKSYGGVRAACGVGVLPANGLVHVLPNGLACGCGALHATVAMEPGAAPETVDEKVLPEPVPGTAPAKETPAEAGDWPMYLADAARSGLGAKDLRPAHALAWDVKLPGTLTPCIAAGDSVYVGSTDECLRALDAATGKTRWTFRAAGPFRAAPAYWNGRVFAGCDDGWLYALNASDGSLCWKLRAAPFARRQVAFETVISPWPVRQGVAVADGTVFFSAGFMPGTGIYAYGADAATGRALWREALGKTSIIPVGHLAAAKGRVAFPSLGSASIYHPVLLGAKDGKRLPGHVTHDDFTEIRFVEGAESDDAEYRDGFLLRGGAEAWVRGYRQGAGYCGSPRQNHSPYALYIEGWTSKMKHHNPFADGHSFLPLFTPKQFFYRERGILVGAARANLFTLIDTRMQKGNERDALYAWKAQGLPCGEPQWLVGAQAGDALALLAGGPRGVAAVDASSGTVLWSAAWEGASHAAALGRSGIYVAAPDGTVRALRAK